MAGSRGHGAGRRRALLILPRAVVAEMTELQSPPAGKRASFDNLSLRANDEADIVTSAPGFVAILNARLFEADFANSPVVTE